MSEEQTIHVEEDATEQGGQTFTEEMKVAGEDLFEAIKSLLHEVTVRRIAIKNADNRVLLEIPIVLGVAGIAWAPMWAALGLIAALATDCTIYVDRVEKQPQTAE